MNAASPVQSPHRIDKSSLNREEQKKKLKYMRDKDRELVRGIFKFYEVPGGSMSFVYKAYKEDQVENYSFSDEGIYTIPIGVAKHLNKNGWYPIHQHQVNEQGIPTAVIGKKVRRFGFQSLEFTDIEELDTTNHIITVQSL